jgi:hypothetical protein
VTLINERKEKVQQQQHNKQGENSSRHNLIFWGNTIRNNKTASFFLFIQFESFRLRREGITFQSF